MTLGGPLCAVQAGSCAALASVSAKIATSSEVPHAIATITMRGLSKAISSDQISYIEEVAICVRLLGVAGIFLFNAFMWVLFTKSMHLCSSTLEATAINTSSNFILTAVIGYLLFGEHISLQWGVGSALIVLGLVVLHRGSSGTTDERSKDSQDLQREWDSDKLKKS